MNLKLVHTGKRGWGVVADAKIESGSFIAEYVGERIRNDLADERLIGYDLASKGHALLIIRQVLPSGLTLRSNIDATLVGNIARFFNHSCDPNLELVIVHRSGCLLPSVALYSIRNIEAGKELTFSYGASASPSPLSSVQGGKECLCGASGCKGVMPAQ